MDTSLRYLLIVFIMFLSFLAEAQNYADKKIYLVDSLEIDRLEDFEKKILETAIQQFHDASHDTVKVSAIVYIIEESWDYNVWPRYNDWLEAFLVETRSRIHRMERKSRTAG